MLDKIGDSTFPVAEDKQSKDHEPSAVVSTVEKIAPVSSTPIWLRLLLGIVQAALMIAILLGSFMLAKKKKK